MNLQKIKQLDNARSFRLNTLILKLNTEYDINCIKISIIDAYFQE